MQVQPAGKPDRGAGLARSTERWPWACKTVVAVWTPISCRTYSSPFSDGVRSPRRTPGVGLGLAVAQRIATSSGATLTAESEAGAGCLFVIHLPEAPASERPGGQDQTSHCIRSTGDGAIR